MKNERRQDHRATIPLPVLWRGADGEINTGTLGDISRTGGYVLTSGITEPDEEIMLQINFPDGTRLSLRGRAIYQVSDLGFTVEFYKLTRQQANALQKAIEQHS